MVELANPPPPRRASSGIRITRRSNEQTCGTPYCTPATPYSKDRRSTHVPSEFLLMKELMIFVRKKKSACIATTWPCRVTMEEEPSVPGRSRQLSWNEYQKTNKGTCVTMADYHNYRRSFWRNRPLPSLGDPYSGLNPPPPPGGWSLVILIPGWTPPPPPCARWSLFRVDPYSGIYSTRKNFYKHIRHPGVYTITNCVMIFHFGSCVISLLIIFAFSFLPSHPIASSKKWRLMISMIVGASRLKFKLCS